jgi:hypothetical protein
MISLNRYVCVWLLLVAALATSCKKHSPGPRASNAAPADPSVPADAGVRSPGAPVPIAYAPATIAAPEDSDMSATLQQLSRELRKYVVSARSVPKSFEEFIAKSHVQTPPVPAGKKYKIQGHAVVLVKG